MRLCISLFLLLISGSSAVFAQQRTAPLHDDPPLRVEIPAKSDKETYRVIPCNQSGALMFFKSLEQVDETHTRWYFTLYDQNLQIVWTKSLPLPGNHAFLLHSYAGDTLSLLFTAEGKNKSEIPDIQVVRVILNGGSFILNPGQVPENALVTSFSRSGNKAWIGLNVKGDAGQILMMDLATNQIRSIRLGEGSILRLRWLRPDTTNTFVTAIVSRQISKKVEEHYLVRYDSSGRILSETVLNTLSQGRDLTAFQVCQMTGGNDFIAGSYGLGTGSSSKTEKVIETSTGLFAGLVSGSVQKSMLFHNILELKSINSLLSEKDILDLKKKALKKKKGLGEYSVDFSILMHDIFRYHNQFILIGEVVSPQYHTESFTEFDYYGRPYTNSYSVFDGYRFLNAIVAGFDSTGKLLWDNALEIRNLVSYELTPKVSAFYAGDEMVLCYLSDGKIGSKMIREKEVLEKLDFSPLEMLFPDDKLQGETRSRMAPWYENYFLCYGFQEIKNIALSENNKRLVFYFNKVKFEK
jgi:hypothetical protein